MELSRSQGLQCQTADTEIGTEIETKTETETETEIETETETDADTKTENRDRDRDRDRDRNRKRDSDVLRVRYPLALRRECFACICFLFCFSFTDPFRIMRRLGSSGLSAADADSAEMFSDVLRRVVMPFRVFPSSHQSTLLFVVA